MQAIAVLHNQLQQVTTHYDDVQKELNCLENHIRELQDDLSTQNKRISEVNTDIKDAILELQSMQGEYDELILSNDAKSFERDLLISKGIALRSRMSSIVSELNSQIHIMMCTVRSKTEREIDSFEKYDPESTLRDINVWKQKCNGVNAVWTESKSVEQSEQQLLFAVKQKESEICTLKSLVNSLQHKIRVSQQQQKPNNNSRNFNHPHASAANSSALNHQTSAVHNQNNYSGAYIPRGNVLNVNKKSQHLNNDPTFNVLEEEYEFNDQACTAQSSYSEERFTEVTRFIVQETSITDHSDRNWFKTLRKRQRNDSADNLIYSFKEF